MALVEVTEVHQPRDTRILAEHNNNIEVLMDKITYHDGVEHSREQYRLTPMVAGITDDDGEWFDSDISGEDAQTRAVAAAVWTPAVKSKAHLAGARQALEAANGNVNATTQAVAAIKARIAALTAPEEADKLTEAQAELPPAESAKLAAAAKRDVVQTNIDLITEGN